MPSRFGRLAAVDLYRSAGLPLLVVLFLGLLFCLSPAVAQGDLSSDAQAPGQDAVVGDLREVADAGEPSFGQEIAFGVALAGELGDRFPVRWYVSGDLPSVPVRLRFGVDIARQSPLSQATLSLAGGVLLLVPSETVDGYAGLMLGAQFDAAAWPEANDGLFVGALVGVERRLGTRLGVFVEAELDLYFATPPVTGGPRQYDRLYPTIAVGVTVRPFGRAAPPAVPPPVPTGELPMNDTGGGATPKEPSSLE